MELEQRLKEIEFKKNELARYLQISRPTLDKYIKEFESGNRAAIAPRVRRLFEYIEENPLVGKKSATEFIISELSESLARPGISPPEPMAESEEAQRIRKFLAENQDSPKARFFELAVRTTDFDDVARYLLKIYPILRERRPTEAQIALLKPYDDIRAIMENETTTEE